MGITVAEVTRTGGGTLAKNSTFDVESAGEVEREEGEVSGNIPCGNR